MANSIIQNKTKSAKRDHIFKQLKYSRKVRLSLHLITTTSFLSSLQGSGTSFNMCCKNIRPLESLPTHIAHETFRLRMDDVLVLLQIRLCVESPWTHITDEAFRLQVDVSSASVDLNSIALWIPVNTHCRRSVSSPNGCTCVDLNSIALWIPVNTHYTQNASSPSGCTCVESNFFLLWIPVNTHYTQNASPSSGCSCVYLNSFVLRMLVNTHHTRKASPPSEQFYCVELNVLLLWMPFRKFHTEMASLWYELACVPQKCFYFWTLFYKYCIYNSSMGGNKRLPRI